MNSFAINLPIGFPCLFRGILLAQLPTILGPNDALSPNPAILNLSYKLFQGSHVPNNMHNIRPPKAANIPLPENLQVPEGGLHIPSELGTHILRVLSSKSHALCWVIHDLTDRRVEIDSFAHLLNLSMPHLDGVSMSQRPAKSA